MLYLCLAAGVNLAIDLEGQPQIPESGEEDCYSPPRKIIETESQT
jgi:hypothetical protein